VGIARRRTRLVGASRWAALPVLTLLTLLAGCGGHSTRAEQQASQAPTRGVGFKDCPLAEVQPLPGGFGLVRRDLTSLGGQHMGVLKIYRDGVRQIQVFSGPDVYGKLDDVDLVPRRVQVGGRTFQVSTTHVDPTLFVGQLQDDGLRPPCDNVGVLTRHVPMSTFLELLRDLRVTPSTGR